MKFSFKLVLRFALKFILIVLKLFLKFILKFILKFVLNLFLNWSWIYLEIYFKIYLEYCLEIVLKICLEMYLETWLKSCLEIGLYISFKISPEILLNINFEFFVFRKASQSYDKCRCDRNMFPAKISNKTGNDACRKIRLYNELLQKTGGWWEPWFQQCCFFVGARSGRQELRPRILHEGAQVLSG